MTLLKNTKDLRRPVKPFDLKNNKVDLKIQVNDYYRCLDTLDYDWDEHGIDEDEQYDEEIIKSLGQTQPMLIKLFGVLDSGHSITVNLQGFKPFFYVKIPEHWGTPQCGNFIKGLKSKVYFKYKDNLIGKKLIYRKPYTEFTGPDKFKFMKLTFINKESFDQFRWKLMKPVQIGGLNKGRPYKYDLYEANLDPLIKFIHLTEIKPGGTIVIPSKKYRINKSKTTTTDFEINIQWDRIEGTDIMETGPINFGAFDIEADSSHGDFPIGIKNYQKLAQDLITMYNKFGISVIGKGQQKQHPLFADSPKMVLDTALKLAFNDNYNNNGIHMIKTVDNLKPHSDTVDQLAYAIDQLGNMGPLLNDDIINQCFMLLEYNLPEIDVTQKQNSDYLSLSREIISQIELLKKTKNKAFANNSFEVIKLMINLAFGDYFDGFEVNCVYTKRNLKPNELILESIVPDIYKILVDCANFVHFKKLPIPNQFTTDDGTVYNEDNMSQDAFVKLLTQLLDKYLPPVEGDKLIQIGTTFQILGQPDCYLKHMITLGSCAKFRNQDLINDENNDIYLPAEDLAKDLISYELHLNGDQTQTDKSIMKNLVKKKVVEVKGWDQEYRNLQCKKAAVWRRIKQSKTDNAIVVIECFDEERDLLMAWKELILINDPDVLIGYNIFGFDFKFLYQRAIELGCEREFCQMGRIKDLFEPLYEQKLSSAAMGDNVMTYIPMKGRVFIDLCKVIRNSYNLNSYKLDSVCHKFLYKNKNDLPPKEIFIMQKGTAEDRAVIAKYCLIDCILCNRLLTKLVVLGNNIAMANVCKVPLSYLFSRGQGVKIFSLVAYVCDQEGYLVKTLPRADDSNDGYEGAIVLKPYTGIYDEPISVADFNSLYPSSMISENISHDSFVEIGGKYDNLPGYEYSDITYDTYKFYTKPGTKRKIKKKVGVKTSRYVQLPDGQKSILPKILMNLLSARKGMKKKMKDEKDPFKKKIWNGMQLAYKVTANSLYGQCGAKTSPIYKRELAESTTAVGRNMIIFTKKYVETEYRDKLVTLNSGKQIRVKNTYCVYGDTDSCFIKFNCYELDGTKIKGMDAVFICMELCIRSSKEISDQLKKPQNLEFEKVIYPFILISKKRYHGRYYTKMNDTSYYDNSMGIVLKRRDNAPIVKHVFGGAVDIIMNELDVKKAIDFTKKECKKLLNGEFPMSEFIISKTLRSYYKKPNQIAHNVLANRQAQRDPGNKFLPNDRVPFVYFVHPNAKSKKLLQGDKIETPDFIKEANLDIDYKMYLTNQIAKPVAQIFDLVPGLSEAKNLFENLATDFEHEKQGIVKIDNFFKKKEKTQDITKLFDMIEKARTNWESLNQQTIDDVDDGDSSEGELEDVIDAYDTVKDVEYYSSNYENPDF